METHPTHLPALLAALRREFDRRISQPVRRYWFKTALFSLAVTAFVRRDLQVSIAWDALNPETMAAAPQPEKMALSVKEEPPLNVSLLQTKAKTPKKKARAEAAAPAPKPALPANEEEKRRMQETYVQKYAHIAQAEMEKFGIPASITLAQGLLETNAGASPLVTTANNHFGIKCFSRSCSKGHCRNYSDDSHKDFFRIFPSAWASYRAHSTLLQKPRYRPLFELSSGDYKGWASGLKRAGYATDPNYAAKLINLIETLDLHRFDE